MTELLRSKFLINQTKRVFSPEELEILCLGLDFVPARTLKFDAYGQSAQITDFKSSLNRALVKRTRSLALADRSAIPLRSTPNMPTLTHVRARVAFNRARALLIRKGHVPRISLIPCARKQIRRGLMGKWLQAVGDGPDPQSWEHVPEIKRLLHRMVTTGDIHRVAWTNRLAGALKNLAQDDTVYLTAADKGGGTVIWGAADYKKEAERQLEDSKTYTELSPDLLIVHKVQIQMTLSTLSNRLLRRKNITAREAWALTAPRGDPAAFYMLPKIHKPMNQTSGTFAGRPIVATHSSPTHLIDKYLTELTRPLLKRIQGSLLDTTHLINLLPTGKLPPNTRIITADVNSLYPSIPWKEGVEASVDFYRKNMNYLYNLHRGLGLLDPPTPGIFGTLLKLVLENSLIHYQGLRYFRQIKGTAMGCCVSVYFANTYMLEVTKDILESPPGHIILFERFIDDILLITTGTDGDIAVLFQSITNEHISYEVSKAALNGTFLDLELFLLDGRIHTRTYSKPTSVPFYLHAKSCHHPHLLRSIPYAQLLRIKRNSSRAKDYLRRSKSVLASFKLRGYPNWLLAEAFQKCEAKPRFELLQRRKEFQTPSRLHWCRPFGLSDDWGHLKYTLRKIYSLIVQHYAGTAWANTVDGMSPSLVATSSRTVGSFFSGSIKNPRRCLDTPVKGQ